MDWVMVVVIAVVVLAGALLSAYVVSSVISSRMGELYSLMVQREVERGISRGPERREKRKTSSEMQQPPQREEPAKMSVSGINEDELIQKLRKVIDEKVQNVLNEAKHKKERLLMLLDVARGYTLGYISEDEYNAFLMKVLGELEEFKRLWLARFPSQKDREKLNQLIGYVARTKLPITVKQKGEKEVIKLPPEEALIRITSNINAAVSILDELMSSRGESPAVTALEIKLSQECERLRAKVEKLERELEEYRSLT